MPATAGDEDVVPIDKAEKNARPATVALQATVELKPEASAPEHTEPAAGPQLAPPQTMPEPHTPPTVGAPKPSGKHKIKQQIKTMSGSGKKAKKGRRK